MRRVPTGCNTNFSMVSSSTRNETKRLALGGSAARQLSALLNSITKSGMPLIEGDLGLSASPHEMSKSTEMSMENNQRSMDKVAVPLASQGAGPESFNFKLTLKTSAFNTSMTTEKEISMTKWNGENWNTASKLKFPCRLKALIP